MNRPPEHHFAQQYCTSFWDSSREPIIQLAEHAVDLMEWHDELVCRHRDERGVAIPVTTWERQACGAYAREVREDLGELARRLGYRAEDWRDELRRANERYDRLVRDRARGR